MFSSAQINLKVQPTLLKTGAKERSMERKDRTKTVIFLIKKNKLFL